VGIAAQWTLDVFALAEVARVIRRVWDRVQAERQLTTHDVTEGAHCRWCNAWLSCPAQLGSVRAVLGADIDALTPELTAEAYVRAKAAEKLVERIKRTTKTLVSERGPIAAGSQTISLTSNKALRIART
jgi:hypothetical protein